MAQTLRDNRRSETGQAVQKWYRSKRWAKVRAQQLAQQPYCQCPHHKGQRVKAEVVDHITPHRGDERLFWNTSNLQSMTKQCHDSFKQSQEKGGAGFLKGCDASGFPLSHEHPWRIGTGGLP